MKRARLLLLLLVCAGCVNVRLNPSLGKARPAASRPAAAALRR